MARVVLLTGGNLGDVSGNMLRVIDMLSSGVGDVILASKVYDTPAWGFESSDIFQNQALVIDTELDPYEVLAVTQNIEREFGKIVGSIELTDSGDRVYHSREMDIDILFYDDIILESDYLTIPHPRLHLRSFVLNPLREIIGNFIHPQLGISINDIKD